MPIYMYILFYLPSFITMIILKSNHKGPTISVTPGSNIQATAHPARFFKLKFIRPNFITSILILIQHKDKNIYLYKQPFYLKNYKIYIDRLGPPDILAGI